MGIRHPTFHSMSWAEHVDAISMKVNQKIGPITRTRNLLPLHARVTLYKTFILPPFDYRDVIWEDKNNKALMSGLPILLSTEVIKILDLKPLSTKGVFHRCISIQKCLLGETDFNFIFIWNQAVHSHNARRWNNLRLSLPRTNWDKQTFTSQRNT